MEEKTSTLFLVSFTEYQRTMTIHHAWWSKHCHLFSLAPCSFLLLLLLLFCIPLLYKLPCCFTVLLLKCLARSLQILSVFSQTKRLIFSLFCHVGDIFLWIEKDSWEFCCFTTITKWVHKCVEGFINKNGVDNLSPVNEINHNHIQKKVNGKERLKWIKNKLDWNRNWKGKDETLLWYSSHPYKNEPFHVRERNILFIGE